LAAVLCCGCATTTLWHEVVAEVSFEAPSDAPVQLSWYQTWHGVGELARPLRPLGEVTLPNADSVSQVMWVPVEEGEGLSIHAWQDIDGDGLLCAPGTSEDVAGLWVSEEDPDFTLSIILTLAEPCAPAEALYP